jgi:ribosomal protein S18 acetylase RimI-like enzyme
MRGAGSGRVIPGTPSSPGFAVREITEAKETVSAAILGDLPEWFGFPGAIEGYARSIRDLPTWGCETDSGLVGFLSLKVHAGYSAEIHVLAVKREWHRRGIGKALVACAEERARAMALPFLTVKTVAAEDPSPFYARTRAFYMALGFRPLEVFKTLFRSGDPCLLMVKPLAG